MLITAIAVVVALVAGAAVWFFAFRDTNDTTGAASPQDAVNGLFTTLSNSDPIGLADQLDPAEASLFTDLNADVIGELQRLEVLSPEASMNSMTGTQISVSGLTYESADETINDRLRIVKLTGGSVTITSDPANVPLSDKFKERFGADIAAAQPETQTINIADLVAEQDGEPVRVATVRRGDQWYVSLFYTIADNWAHSTGAGNPTEADRIDPQGSPTPEAAVDELVKRATAGDVAEVIALLPPDEMAVLHDYGTLLLRSAEGGELTGDLGSVEADLGLSIGDVTWTTSEVTGGTKVSFASATITADGQTATITRDGDSLTVTADGQPEITIDPSTLDTYIAEWSGGESLDPQLVDIIKREWGQILNLGLVTVQVGEDWYVSPSRSVSDIFVSLLQGLEPQDIDYLLEMAGG